MKARHVVSLLGTCSALMAPAASSFAADSTPENRVQVPPSVTMLGGGSEGRLDGDPRKRGPGWEQASVVNMMKDGVSYIVIVAMQSIDDQQYGPWQCSCMSYQLNVNGPPTVATPVTRLTSLTGNDKNCNHPKATTVPRADGDLAVWMYGSNSGSNRTMTYAGAIDSQCRQVVAPILVSKDPNENEGAPDVAYNLSDAAGNAYVTGAYLSTGGDNDSSNALGLTLSTNGTLFSLTETWFTTVVAPSNIGRPTLAADGNRTLFAASAGHQRPAEGGVVAAWLDAQSGSILWKNVVAPADPSNHKFLGQPTVAKLSDGRFVMNAVESNGAGQNTNLKGSNLAHLFAIDVASDALTVSAETTGLSVYQTHSTLTTGAYGPNATPVAAILSASPTGIGRPAFMMVGYDSTQKVFSYDPTNDVWPFAWYGDSGHLANWYGENPGRQGRDFLRAIGGVTNPGFQQPGGFMPNAATFFVAAVAGRDPGDQKNSLYLSVTPGVTDQAVAPGNPIANGQPIAPPSTSGSGSGPSATSSSGGCACTTTGASSNGTGVGGLALFGLALCAAFSRRRAGSR